MTVYALHLTERELADLLGAIMALRQLVGDSPEIDSLDRLIAKLDRALMREPAK